jgi:hypothetical protein
MNIGSVQASQTIPFYQLVTAKYSSEKLSIPVAGGKHLYAQFEHVKGIPAENGKNGVPVVKLKILDTLIKQIGSLQGDLQRAAPNYTARSDDLDSEQLTAMISHYQDRLHALLTDNTTPYTHNFLEPGLFINMVA